MGNYYATRRTNYFTVTDEERCAELFNMLHANDCDIADFTETKDGKTHHGLFEIKFTASIATETFTADSPENLIQLWEELLPEHEGETYEIIDTSDKHVILSGAMDPADIDILEEFK